MVTEAPTLELRLFQNKVQITVYEQTPCKHLKVSLWEDLVTKKSKQAITYINSAQWLPPPQATPCPWVYWISCPQSAEPQLLLALHQGHAQLSALSLDIICLNFPPTCNSRIAEQRWLRTATWHSQHWHSIHVNQVWQTITFTNEILHIYWKYSNLFYNS